MEQLIFYRHTKLLFLLCVTSKVLLPDGLFLPSLRDSFIVYSYLRKKKTVKKRGGGGGQKVGGRGDSEKRVYSDVISIVFSRYLYKIILKTFLLGKGLMKTKH